MLSNEPAQLNQWAPERWLVADDWRAVVDHFVASETGRQLGQFIRDRLASGAVIYPPQPLRALALIALAQVKVVILGQDPYHGAGQAEGLAFSVAPGIKIPPSLCNIFKEIDQEPSLERAALSAPRDGSLVRWALQGVLLLNTSLTVERGQPASHARRGWEMLTDAIVQAVASSAQPAVFMLWGAHAQAKAGLIAASRSGGGGAVGARHLVLSANHPSPLSARRRPQPFLGCGHFAKANLFLQQHSCSSVAW